LPVTAGQTLEGYLIIEAVIVPKLNGNPDFGSGQRTNGVKRYIPGVKLGIL